MTKTLLTPLMLAATLAMGGVTPTLAADAIGEWARPGGSSKIRISVCGSALCGKLIWLKSPRNDTANPNPAKRARPLLGVQIVRSMKPTGKTNQWKGKVYNAEDGKTYTGFIEMPSANRMKLEGCVMGGLVCKGETWTRIK